MAPTMGYLQDEFSITFIFMAYQLEVCAFTIQSCLIAERVGAARVELCDNPLEGGTTPSYGTIKKVREAISIALYPIIRPRSMNYYYDAEEWAIVKEDVLLCKQLGCDGVSVGAQLIDGRIDKNRMQQAAEWAYPMGITCNRAFDAVPDPLEALETLIAVGCERVLTSGLAATAPEGAKLLQQLVQQAAGRISIMPGAGVRASNLKMLMETTGATEFHTSARKNMPNTMQFANPLITDAGGLYVADEAELLQMMELLRAANQRH
jgi:copper homeostasis protein